MDIYSLVLYISLIIYALATIGVVVLSSETKGDKRKVEWKG